MSPGESMIRRAVWYSSGADPARLAEYVPTGAVTYMIPSRNRRELPGPDSRPAEEKAKAIFELMAKLGIRYVLEPADSQPGAQFVRPVEEVFRASGQGTCLDLCVAFSSAALDAGLHPMILTVINSNRDRHSIVLIPLNRTWLASGRPEPVADSEVVREPFLLDDMPLKAMVYRTATGSGALLAINVQQASRKPDGTPFGDWESAVSRGADFLTGETGWDWDVCVDIGALRGAMEAPHSVYAPPRARVLEPGYLKPAPGATRSPLQLIKARTGIVPFTGRDKLTELTDWANKQPEESREDLAVAVVTGVGGSGKTRLAAELCSNLEKNGWVAGFIPKTTGLSEVELTWLTKVESHLLLVLDYAEESHKEELTRLLRRLRERAAPTRVVLTARSAGAWLDDLLEDDVLSGAMAQELRRFELPHQAETSTKMAKRAAKRFARYLETPEPTDVEIPQNSRWATLDFVLHGWLIASEVDAASLPNSRERLYEDILRREIKYWQDEAALQGMAKVSEATLRTSAAALSLIGPRTVSEMVDVLSRLPEWSEAELRKTYAELLSKMLADPGDAYVLRPDPVAEKLIVEVFVDDGETLDDPEELLNRVLPPDPLSDSRLNETTCPPVIARRALCHVGQSQQVCDVITRCTSQGDAPATQLAHSALRCRTHLWISGLEAALKQGGPFVTALEDALKDGMNIPAAEIADSIPPGHAYLRSVAVTAMTRDQEKNMTPTERAAYMNDLSNRLSEVGDREGALKAIWGAVGIRRGLVEGNPAAFNPDLAKSLNNLSARLSEVGDREGALKAIREAIGIYHGLAEGNPGAFNPDLAMSLNNLSVVLSEVGDREGALKAIREAIGIYRGLVEGNPGAFSPDLAKSLNNLSARLSGVGDRGGALKAVWEAVGIYRGLAEGNPGAFNPDLAMSLNNLSVVLSGVGDREGALKAIREAIGIYRGLAEGNPGAFSPDLAKSLNNLSARLSEVGDREGALKAAWGAVGIYRGLAEGNPGAFSPGLASSLSNLSNCLSEVGDREGALKAAWEAVGIRRGLVEGNPAAVNPDLAKSLNNLSVVLSEVGDREGALEVIREAVEIRRGLAKRNAAAFEADLVRSLNILARLLTEAGETEEALRCFTDETESFPTGLQALLWLARARWQGQARGVDDLYRAAELADAQDDPPLLGRVRRAIAETAAEWQAAFPTKRWEELPDWATYDLSEHLETIQTWIQCTNGEARARPLRSPWPAPTENDAAPARAAAERYIDVPEISTLADIVEAIAEQGLEPVLSEMQTLHESGALVIGWRTAHAERKGRQYLKEHQTMVGNPHCREVLQRLGLPDDERGSLLALLNLATVSSVDLAYDVAEDLEDADDAIRDFIDAANVPGMYCVLRLRPDLAEGTLYGKFAAALFAYLTGHPEEGRRYLDLIGTTVNPDDRESFRRCVHTLGRDPDYTDALAPVAEWLRTG